MRAVLLIALALVGLMGRAEAFSALSCSRTPVVATSYYPGHDKIPHSNNLRRATGSPMIAEGVPLELVGRVMDKDCVPLKGAVIELWQADAQGRYKQSGGSGGDPAFVGAGRAVADNTGFFQFLTVMPGAYSGKQAPRLFIRVRQLGKKALMTTLFFANDPLTETDAVVKKLSPKNRELLLLQPLAISSDNPLAGMRASVELSLDVEQDFRGF